MKLTKILNLSANFIKTEERSRKSGRSSTTNLNLTATYSVQEPSSRKSKFPQGSPASHSSLPHPFSYRLTQPLPQLPVVVRGCNTIVISVQYTVYDYEMQPT